MPVHQSPLYSICVSAVIEVLLHQAKMMMEEDENPMFDQAGLLPGDHGDDEITSIIHRAQTPKCLAFFLLGLCIAIPGPTLLDLQEQTNTDTEQISRLFTGYSVGYLAGSVIGGFLFDKINQSFLLSLCLIVAAVATAAIPILAFQEASMDSLTQISNIHQRTVLVVNTAA